MRPAPEQRRRIQRGPQVLPAEAAARLRQGHRLVEQRFVQVVRDQPLAKRDQRALGERRAVRAQTAQRQLPPRIHRRILDRLGIADLIVGLEQQDHRQQRRRNRPRAPRLIDRR